MMADDDELTRKQAMMAGIPYIVTKQFPWKLHEMLETVEKNGEDSIVSWLPNGLAFKVHRPSEFAEKVMKTHFNGQGKYKSFQRQLNLWGFERHPNQSPNIDFRGSYYHPLFIRGRKDLCSEMTRQKIKSTGWQMPDKSHEKSNHYASRPVSKSSSLVFSSSRQIKSLLPVPPPEVALTAKTVSTSDHKTRSTPTAPVSFSSLLDESLLVPQHHFETTTTPTTPTQTTATSTPPLQSYTSNGAASNGRGGVDRDGDGASSSLADAAAFNDPVFLSTNDTIWNVDALEAAASMLLGQRRETTIPTQTQTQTQTSSSNHTAASTRFPTTYTENSILDNFLATQNLFSQFGGGGGGGGTGATTNANDLSMAASSSSGAMALSEDTTAPVPMTSSYQANNLWNLIAAMPSGTSQQHHQLENSSFSGSALAGAFGNATATAIATVAPSPIDWLGSSLAQADEEVMNALRRRAALETLLKSSYSSYSSSSSPAVYHPNQHPHNHPSSAAAPPAPVATGSNSLLTAAQLFETLTRNSC